MKNLRVRQRWLRLVPLGCAIAVAAASARAAETSIAFEARGRPTHALLVRPADATALVVIGHGGQLHMRSPLQATLAEMLAARKIATLRFNFPFADAGGGKPDPGPVLVDTVQAAVRIGRERSGGAPVVLAGQSLSGILVARTFAKAPLPVAGVVMLGFPLHQPGIASGQNGRLLEAIHVPLLLVQGSRDPLAELHLVRALAEQLGAKLRVVYDAGHRFEPARRRADERALIEQVADAIAEFTATLPPRPGGKDR